MHYKNGRPAKNGDKIIVFPSYGAPYAGVLYDAVPGNDHCNGRVAVISGNDPMPNLKECLRQDDVASIPFSPSVEPATSTPPPPVDNAHVAEGCEKFSTPTPAE
jgi:hypothetical protein